MRHLVRTAALTGVAGALMLLAAPASQAATSTSASAAACITVTEEEAFGRGQITLCPQSDGTTRATGYVEDLKPGSGWGAPDGYCAAWYIELTDDFEFGPMVCPHFSSTNKTKKVFDYTFTPASPVTGATLGIVSM